MAKKPSLASALDIEDETPLPPPATGKISKNPSSGERTVMVGAHLNPRYGKALKILSAETGQSNKQLLEEALRMLFVAKGSRIDI